jgi:hypothetical protein
MLSPSDPTKNALDLTGLMFPYGDRFRLWICLSTLGPLDPSRMQHLSKQPETHSLSLIA